MSILAIVIIEKTEREKRMDGDIDTLIAIRKKQLSAYRHLLRVTDGAAAGAVLGNVPFDTYDIIFRYRQEWNTHVKNLENELEKLIERKAARNATVLRRRD